jgi:hypothetical protein
MRFFFALKKVKGDVLVREMIVSPVGLSLISSLILRERVKPFRPILTPT